MGVKLGEIVPRKEIDWDVLKSKVIAVDASNMFYQFISSIRQPDGTPLSDREGRVTSHLVGLFARVPNLMSKGIKPVFVFDGKAPKLKAEEQARRRNIKIQAEEKYEKAKQEEDVKAMGKYARQVSRLNKEMIEEAKELIKALGLPVIQAPSEAEAQASYICRKKKAWAIASQDFDSLLYRTPRMLMNLTLAQKKKLPGGGYTKVNPTLIELKEVLDKLELEEDQLIILSILIGTDFNIKGVKGIGPKKALQLVQSGKKFEEIFKDLETDFDWKEIFNVFKKMPVEEDYDITFGEVDPDKIKEILVEGHDFSEERVDNTLEKINKGMNKNQTALNKWL